MTVGTVAEGLPPGSRIRHAELGEGGVLEAARDCWMRAFFAFGERRVALTAVQSVRLRAERMRSAVEGSCSSEVGAARDAGKLAEDQIPRAARARAAGVSAAVGGAGPQAGPTSD